MVMFNERHINPACRLLVNKTLQQLYNKGFRVLALEDFYDETESINQGYPITIDNGFYAREPHMANLIRNAHSIGFRVIGYENDTEGKERELGQAENLYNKTIAQESNCKVIVLAGGGHINETIPESGQPFMAHWFAKLTGINPLTINQVNFLENASEAKIEIVVKPTGIENDIYLTNGLTIDCIFLGDNLDYYDIKFPIDKWSYDGNRGNLFQLYRKAEWEKNRRAVPVLIRTIADLEMLTINAPVGDYIGLIKDEYGQTLFSRVIKIQKDGTVE